MASNWAKGKAELRFAYKRAPNTEDIADALDEALKEGVRLGLRAAVDECVKDNQWPIELRGVVLRVRDRIAGLDPDTIASQGGEE